MKINQIKDSIMFVSIITSVYYFYFVRKCQIATSRGLTPLSMIMALLNLDRPENTKINTQK